MRYIDDERVKGTPTIAINRLDIVGNLLVCK